GSHLVPPAPVTAELWPAAATSIQNDSVPKDSSTARRQAEDAVSCHQQRLEGIYAQTWGASFEAPRVHHAARRRGGVDVASARAAGGDAGNRVPQQPIARRVCRPPARVPPGPQGERLCRGRERGDRIPLGRESDRSTASARGRTGSPAGRRAHREWPWGV